MITEISSLKKLPQTLEDGQWCIFDVDYTLTEPNHPVLSMQSIQSHRERFKKEFAKYAKDDPKRTLLSMALISHVPHTFTEPEVPEIIQSLQQSKGHTFCCTALETAFLPGTGSLVEWRHKEFQRLGLSFSIDTLFSNEHIFTDFPQFNGSYPVYKDGVLFTNFNVSKGALLTQFFSMTRSRPKRVIFVDDLMENLVSVVDACKKEGIECNAYHYKNYDETKLIDIEKEWDKIFNELHQRIKENN